MIGLFLRASCGCIVLNAQPCGDRYIVVKPCDSDGLSPTFFPRGMKGKTFELCGDEECAKLRQWIANELSRGGDFREIQALLKG